MASTSPSLCLSVHRLRCPVKVRRLAWPLAIPDDARSRASPSDISTSLFSSRMIPARSLITLVPKRSTLYLCKAAKEIRAGHFSTPSYLPGPPNSSIREAATASPPSTPRSRFVQSPITKFPARKRAFSTSTPCRATTRESLMDVTGFAGTTLLDVREAVGKVCEGFGDDYWAERDESGEYPLDFHTRLAADGWIGIALPEELGGAGLGISEATMMLETISESGAGMAGSQSIHANVYATQPVTKFGTPSQLRNFLPPLIKGTSRACFGVTEPNTGLDTLKLKTFATTSPDGASYSITGQKIWISSAQVATHMILLARTTPLSQVTQPSHGLSLFLIPLDKSHPGLSLRQIPKMGARAIDANEVFFDNYEVAHDCLIGAEGQGFKIVLHGMNAERCLLAGEALGLGYAALEKAARYARERVVFGRAIGMNQGVAHPLAECWMALEAAKGATFHAAGLYDRSVGVGGGAGVLASGSPRRDAGAEEKISSQAVGVACNTAKYLAAEAAFKACERAVLTLGGMGYAKEYHVERYLRECFIPRIAPVSREMVLNFIGEKVLGLPRSY